MKHLDLFFKENVLKCLMQGGEVSGLSFDMLVLLLQDTCSYNKKGGLLFLFEDSQTSELVNNNISFFEKKTLFYPSNKNNNNVLGFDSKNNRHRVSTLINLGTKKNNVCFSDVFSATKTDINKKQDFKKIIVKEGGVVGRDQLISKLFDFGYKKVDFVLHHNDFSVRGDIIDIFPQNKKNPIRVCFEYEVVEFLCLFDIETQRKTKTISKAVIFDVLRQVVETGRSLLSFINWVNVFYVKRNRVGFFVRSKAVNEKHHIDLSYLLQKPVEIQNLKTIDKNKKVVVFYTNEKNKNKIKKRGHFPVPGLINAPLQTNIKNCYFFQSKGGVSNKKTTPKSLFLNNLKNINMGDFLVHTQHGVGKYIGLKTRGEPGFEKEYLEIEYADNGRLFVPLSKLELIHRYISPQANPRLSSLGKKTWNNDIIKTKKSIEKISKALVSIYTSRNKPRGFSYSRGKNTLSALKKSFPFEETLDQKNVINEVLKDLDKKTPMDRLVCGDVGFGKTEVALRALAKVSASSKQSVFLCPTTVLADQHYITASNRLRPLGISVSLLSRFGSKKSQKNILKSLIKTTTDVVIGTHRLLSDDVVIPSLGLLIIDEEHRFGVKHKEKIRQLRFGVDVLSLSATPIPRTLQQSMLGIRDISMINTPPITRKPIETHVEYFSWDRCYEIIKNEVLRGGQVYFLHNRVQSIDYYTEKIQKELPGVVVKNIHGQQNSKALENNLLGFFSGKISVLVCSTIIESGLDVPNANCIIINNPQNLGLSQLYQIRGRVGRGEKQAYCYLTIPKKTKLAEKAFRRLKTIERQTSLGSGYSVATADLDIRGGGSVFGYKQSGEIAKVGFNYYNKLLKESINNKLNISKSEKKLDVVLYGKALIPKRYINNESERLLFYNKINTAKKKTILLDIKKELIDRFGKLPTETNAFINVSLIKAAYKKTCINKIEIQNKNIVCFVNNKQLGDQEIENILTYKNINVIKLNFKNLGGSTGVVFMIKDNTNWFNLLLDCRHLFLN